MSIDMKDYSGLDGFGFSRQAPVDPEKETFHAIYVTGQSRKLPTGGEEEVGKFQIRGVLYNQEKVFMIITHVKTVLVKESNEGGKDKVVCFSFAEGPKPWKGTSGNTCGAKAAERAANPYCAPCRSQLIVAGVLLDQSGKMIRNKETNEPVFGFIRGKGIKYGPVSDYLSEMVNKDYPPIVTPVTEESKKWEKKNLNYRRVVTVIEKGTVDSRHGRKTVSVLKSAGMLPDDKIQGILKLSKEYLNKFNAKFDWSKKSSQSEPTGYTFEPKVEEGQTFDLGTSPAPASQPAAQKEDPKQEEKKKEAFISFDDVEF